MDPDYDGLLSVMGALAKKAPKLVIDSIMVWRKSKNDAMMETNETLVPDHLKRELLKRLNGLKGRDIEFLIRERRSVSFFLFFLFLFVKIDTSRSCPILYCVAYYHKS